MGAWGQAWVGLRRLSHGSWGKWVSIWIACPGRLALPGGKVNLLKCVWGTQQAFSKGMDGTRKVSLEMDPSREETMLPCTGKLEFVGQKE